MFPTCLTASALADERCRWRADGTFREEALRLRANSIGWPCHVVDEWFTTRPSIA